MSECSYVYTACVVYLLHVQYIQYVQRVGIWPLGDTACSSVLLIQHLAACTSRYIYTQTNAYIQTIIFEQPHAKIFQLYTEAFKS